MRLESIRKFENIHIALWLLKDTFWVLDLHILGMFMIFPTLFLAVYITWKFRSIRSETMHNLAVCFWIMANSTWMTGEFFFNDSLRPYATLFFISGLAIVGYHYLFQFKRGLNKN
ncbi:MAG TPA: hypothetical protein VGD22_08955 [Sphingobacteriaceae bacterium]